VAVSGGVTRACRDQPVTCRGKIAGRYGLKPNKRKPWQYEGRCPKCRHGGFSLAAGDQGHNPPRHVWHCNCHRCQCDPHEVRMVMLADGIPETCLGSYASRSTRTSTRPPAPPDPAAVLREAMLEVLADPALGTAADLRIRMLEVAGGESAPEDWPGFVAFAGRAGVSRSKRSEAAARWGRSATAVGIAPTKAMSSGRRSGGKSIVPFRDSGHIGHISETSTSETRAERFVPGCVESPDGITDKTDTRRSEAGVRNARNPVPGHRTVSDKPGRDAA
jgi:hypothetical protein